MCQPEKKSQDHESAALAAAADFLSRCDSQLISTEELAGHVTALLATGVFTDAYQACRHVYAETLYYACTNTRDIERRQTGWTELYRHLISVARYYRLSDGERDEAAHQALLEISHRLTQPTKRFSAIRTPAAFLWVATQQVRNVVRRRYHDKWTSWDTTDEELAGPAASTPEQLFDEYERRQRVLECFEQTSQRHPRAKMQLAVVRMRLLDGCEYEDIAATLNMDVRAVYMLHTRGLRLLRKDPGWRMLAQEHGLLSHPE